MAAGPLPPYPTGQSSSYGPFIPGTLTDGWCYGAITEYLRPDLPGGCDSGDGFVVAPDGSYRGLVWWRDCPWTRKRIGGPRRASFRGVSEVRFPVTVRSVADLVANFRLILPRLRLRRAYLRRAEAKRPAPQSLGQARTMVVSLPASVRLRASPEVFREICCENPDLRLERAASGRLVVLPPVGAMTSAANAQLSGRLGLWNRATGRGAAFGSDLGCTLPNGAVRSTPRGFRSIRSARSPPNSASVSSRSPPPSPPSSGRPAIDSPSSAGRCANIARKGQPSAG